MKISIEFNPETDSFDKVIGAVGLAYNWHISDAEGVSVQSKANSALRSINLTLDGKNKHLEKELEKLQEERDELKRACESMDDIIAQWVALGSYPDVRSKLRAHKSNLEELKEVREHYTRLKELIDGRDTDQCVQIVRDLQVAYGRHVRMLSKWEAAFGGNLEEAKAAKATAMNVAHDLRQQVIHLEAEVERLRRSIKNCSQPHKFAPDGTPERDVNEERLAELDALEAGSERSVIAPDMTLQELAQKIEAGEEPPPFAGKEQRITLCSSTKILKGDLRD